MYLQKFRTSSVTNLDVSGVLGICNEFGTIEGSLWIERAKEVTRCLKHGPAASESHGGLADTEVPERANLHFLFELASVDANFPRCAPPTATAEAFRRYLAGCRPLVGHDVA